MYVNSSHAVLKPFNFVCFYLSTTILLQCIWIHIVTFFDQLSLTLHLHMSLMRHCNHIQYTEKSRVRERE